MDLTFARLDAVRHVAHAGSFAAAARAIGISQPAVSQHVRDLEASYGVRLFVRNHGKLFPTQLCNELCDMAERISAERLEAERLLTRRTSLADGQIIVGLGNAMPGMAVVAEFHRTHPGVTLRVETGPHDKITRAVLSHEVDVGILPNVREDNRFRRAALAPNQVVAIAPPNHPLARKDVVSAAELQNEALIFRARGSSTQRVVDRMFAALPEPPTPLLTLDTRDGLYEAVVNGLGIGFIWKFATSRTDGVQRLAISDLSGAYDEIAFSLKDSKSRVVDAFFGSATFWRDGV
ncbi:LysR substrate-binding domain-containing protein [Hoeflea prorocentri]|uniref:LysR substrate-binding domain-containing protein n=1 Tax=Hoeflea prorocentri TaxID=1922333 RepID=A0A9X3ZHT1_9HYPH|nr:LysR substrate-binding domain-containing protein [Hoeflea prorocentri]MCY6382167.1 LysR substrate-binding domain-containing protein [Hoeflea prorocentri]MDA5399967.1 LysR substrate-binding domain-containing protein [Hoeflea prorocentri]